jgi:glycosyltransferase involved in cell wall biosynthesis
VVVGSKDFAHGKAFGELARPRTVIPAPAKPKSGPSSGGKAGIHGSPIKTFGDDNFKLESKSIVFTGYLTQPELNTLYCGAEALIFPSLYEGFGIPVLEAMACGVPVLTSHISSLPEVAGNAALLVDPYQAAQIAEGMQLLAENPRLRQSFIERGFQQIQKFSWKKTALETLKVYESLE